MKEEIKYVASKQPERILCAATWYCDIELKTDTYNDFRPIGADSGIVSVGHRHANCMYMMTSLFGKRNFEFGKHIQGFLTNHNRFVDREEGAKLFVKNGGKLKYSKSRLFSEDLY